MQRSHMVVGACAAALAGAVCGASIDTTPLPRGIDAWDHIPRHQFTDAELALEAQGEALPDHSPLVTPQGRFEVGELRDRGLYRNRRFGMAAAWADWSDMPEPAYHVAAADYSYVPDDPAPEPQRTAARTAKSDAPVVRATSAEPLAAPEISEPVELPVTPRAINVATALAARQ